MKLLFLTLLLCLACCVRKPEAPYVPPPSAFVQHRVQKGETLSAIARKLTGDAKNYVAILDANPGLNPKKLAIGTVIRVPQGLVMKKGAGGGAKKSKVKETIQDQGTELTEMPTDSVPTELPASTPSPQITPLIQELLKELPAREDVDDGVPPLNPPPTPLSEDEYQAFSVGKTPPTTPEVEIPEVQPTAEPTIPSSGARKRSLLEEMLDSQ